MCVLVCVFVHIVFRTLIQDDYNDLALTMLAEFPGWWLGVCLCVCGCLYVSVCVVLCVRVWVLVYMCVFMCIWQGYASVYLCVRIFLSLCCACGHVCTCAIVFTVWVALKVFVSFHGHFLS